jgi:hypothetical protein
MLFLHVVALALALVSIWAVVAAVRLVFGLLSWALRVLGWLVRL